MDFTSKGWLTNVVVNLLPPILGLISFLLLAQRMHYNKITDAPVISFFIILVSYFGLLQVLLTALFWYWSGLASLGTFYLILIAPVLRAILSERLYKQRDISEFHKWGFI